MPTRLTPLGAASKNAVLVVVALVILGVAGVVAYQQLGPQMAENSFISHKATGNEYRLKLSQITTRQPEKYNTVSMQMVPDEWSPKADKPKLEIGGTVPNQAALDELKKIVADNPAPVEIEWKVKLAGK